MKERESAECWGWLGLCLLAPSYPEPTSSHLILHYAALPPGFTFKVEGSASWSHGVAQEALLQVHTEYMETGGGAFTSDRAYQPGVGNVDKGKGHLECLCHLPPSSNPVHARKPGSGEREEDRTAEPNPGAHQAGKALLLGSQ